MNINLMAFVKMNVFVMISSLCFAESSRVMTTVTHKTQIHHKIVGSDTDSLSSYTTSRKDNSLKMNKGLETVNNELCTDIPNLPLSEISISVPSTTTSDFFVNIINFESSATEEPPSCLVIDFAESLSAERDLSACSYVAHKKWHIREQKTDNDILEATTFHFSYSLPDENSEEVLPHWQESARGSSKVCVGWSLFEEEALNEGGGGVNLTLVQKQAYFSDPEKKTTLSSAKEEAAGGLKIMLNDELVDLGELKLISVSSPSLDDSTSVVLATEFQATSDVITKTVSVSSLIDSAPNVSLCSLASSPDQQSSSYESVTSANCNFRSAVETCTLFLSSNSCVDVSATSCVVLLPPLQTIIMDPEFGEVKISDETLCGSLSIDGSGSIIRPSSSAPLSMRLLNVDLPVPIDSLLSLHIDNVTIMNFGDIATEGGAVRLNNFRSDIFSSVTNVVFRNNSGSNGGALAVSNSGNMIFRGNVFEGNTARGDAGGLFIDSDCDSINITDCLFNFNLAMGIVNTKQGFAGLGGGAMINSRNSLISLINCSFFNNIAIRAGGLGVHDSNEQISLIDVSFFNNTADFGGGMYAVNDNLYVTLTRCHFLGNIGETDTGGLLLNVGNYYMTLLQCTFTGNSARGEGGGAYGGGIYLGSDNVEFALQDCHFTGNSVSSRGGEAWGGGVYLVTNNDYFSLQNCYFSGNSVSSSEGGEAHGGGIYLGAYNYYFSLEGCDFTGNSASSAGGSAFGGGIFLSSHNNDLTLQNCHFSDNFVSSSEGGDGGGGGGISLSSDNFRVTLQDCSFSGNSVSSEEGEAYGGGVYLGSTNYYLTLQDCQFSGNNVRSEEGGAYGGGIFLSNNNYYLTLESCDLFDNSVSSAGGYGGGGGIYLNTDNDYLILQDCQISGNSVSSAEGEAWGGGIYMFSGNWNMQMINCYYSDNSADSGGALCLYAGNWYATLLNVIFRENVARGDGGGLALISGNYDFDISDSFLAGNTAGTRGGGIYSALQNNDIQILSSQLINNSAFSAGGGIYIGETHKKVYLEYMDISGNVALGTAGGAYFGRFSSEVTLTNCQIRNNSAGTVGGLLALLDDMLILSSLFENNEAQGDYGALYVQSSKSFEVTSSNFSNNIAQGNCGAMSVNQTESVTVIFSIFSNNYAKTGGAVCVGDGKIGVSFNNINFQNNIASVSGGALYVVNSINVFIEASSFVDNSALKGDGSAIFISTSSAFLLSSSFRRNRAPLGGGTVFWKSASDMQEPYGLSGSDGGNYFSPFNSARYGNWYATEARYIVPDNDISSLKVVDYSKQAAPSITVFLQDWYNQTVLSDSSSSLTVSVSTSLPSDCYGEEGFVGGLTRLTLLNGSKTFDLLEPVCAPTYNLSLEVVSSLSYVSSLPFQYSFRPCVTGEYYAERVCNPCKEGFYSFVDSSTLSLSDLSSDVCQQCPSGAQRCFKDQIFVKAGYWRISEDSSRIFECPLGESSCMGLNLTGESSCGEGYSGALCAVCGDDYHYLSTEQSCEPCNSTGSFFDSSFIIIICFVSILLVVFGYLLKVKVINKHHISSPDELIVYFLIACRCINDNDFEKNKTHLIVPIKAYRRRVQHRVKIYVTLFQILVALPFVLSLNISSAFDAIISALSFVNVSIADSSVASCSFASKFDFVDKLLFQTMYPLLIILLVALVCQVFIVLEKKKEPLLLSSDSKRDKDDSLINESQKIMSRCIYFGLIFISLILPFTSAIIFSTFSCKNIDPDSSEAGDNSFMTADYSVSCQSQRYFFARSWAIAMIFVYPVGVPILFSILLYRTKDDIIHRNDCLGSDKEEAERLFRLAAIRSLYDAYSPEYWYWEVLETLFRLSLTGFLVLVEQGGYLQIVIGTIFSAIYLWVQNSCRPYEDSGLNVVKSISLGQIFCVLYLALISFAKFVDPSDWRFNALIVLTVFANIPLELFITYIFPRLNVKTREVGLTFPTNQNDL